MPTSIKLWIELVAVLVMAGGLFGVFWTRRRANKDEATRGIGVRVIQMTAVILVVPTILILGLEKLLDTAVLGTLLGAIVGYVLASIGKDERDGKRSGVKDR